MIVCPKHVNAAKEAHRLIQSKKSEDIDKAFELNFEISNCLECEAVFNAASKIRKQAIDASA